MYHKLETGWGRSGGPTSAWLGIDAPEKGQAFGDRAKESLSRLVFDRQIEAHCHKRDRYGREVCKVMHAAADVNLEQIRDGLPVRRSAIPPCNIPGGCDYRIQVATNLSWALVRVQVGMQSLAAGDPAVTASRAWEGISVLRASLPAV
jgi:hypothetical protein